MNWTVHKTGLSAATMLMTALMLDKTEHVVEMTASMNMRQEM